MANVGFKLGPQSAIDTLITKGTNAGAQAGSFYLTSDTHRLYIGLEDTSIAPVNEGVVTVASVSALPTITGSNKAAYAGRFYYATAENILCVFNGQNWAQINSDTYVSKSDFIVTEIADNQIRINNRLYNYNGNVELPVNSDYIEYVGEDIDIDISKTTINGIECHVITFKGDTYSLDAEKVESGVKLNLSSELNSDNDSSVTLIPGLTAKDTVSNVQLSVNEDGNVVIAAKDSRNESISVTGSASSGFNVQIQDNQGYIVNTNFKPKIKYGENAETVDFVNGIATLDVYSKTDIEDTLKALNAMTYRGTIGSNGSAATHITNTNGVIALVNGSANVKCSIGDTFLISSDTITINNTDRLTIGTLIIAKGTEGTDGYITASTLNFDVVESTNDTDTTYQFNSVTVENGGGISLRNQNSAESGVLQIKGDANTPIKIEKSSSALTGKGYKEVLTIKHNAIDSSAQNETSSTAITMSSIKVGDYNNFGKEVTIPVVTSVKSDGYGHVTGVVVQQYKIQDTSGYLANKKYTTSAYDKDSKSVGIVKSSLDFVSAHGPKMTVNDYLAFNSSSLKITNDDSSTIDGSSSTTAQGLNIELVWGSFN